jgi:hypothetical protein
LWERLYRTVFEQRLPGLAGAVTSRAAAQVLRLSAVYALADRTETVDRPHLEAALAVWQYSQQSARHVFGTMTGSRDADRVLAELRHAPLSRTDISVLFHRNKTARQLDQIIGAVLGTGRVRHFTTGSGVRQRDMYELLSAGVNPAAPTEATPTETSSPSPLEKE